MAENETRPGDAGVMYGAEQSGRLLDEIFRSRDGKEPEAYGFAFDVAVKYMENVLWKMSEAVGWKGKARPYNFDGFSGYYPEVRPDRADVCQGDEVVCSFFPRPDGRLGFEAYGDAFPQYGPDVNPWYPLSDIMDGKLCLEEENVRKAVRETHGGQEIVYGFRFGEGCAYSVESDDRELRTALVNRDPNIRMVDADVFGEAVEKWVDADNRPGFEDPVRPEIVRLAWDGATLRDERQVCLDQERDIRDGWANDWDLIGVLREEGRKMRRELQEAAGIPGDRLFKFKDALYPNLGLRNDALFLSTDCGSQADFITVAKGRVGLYRDYDPSRPLPEPSFVFSSLGEAMERVRKVVVGERNVERAAMDYQKYLQSKAKRNDVGQAKSVGHKR